MSLGQRTPGRHEIVPGLPLPLQRDRLRAVGIVEAEHGRLDEGARGPEGRGVRRVALDLGRPPFVALDDQAVGAPAERHRRRVVAGDSGNDVLGSGDKRNDLLDGAPDTPRGARKRQRGAQEHHHVAPADPVGMLRGALLQELPLDARRGIPAIFESARDFASRCGSPVAPRTVSRRSRPARAPPSCAASALASRGGVHFMLVTSETGRRLGPGLRWQSRHQLILSGDICVTVFHLVDAAVAGDTADAARHVRVVVEVGVVGKLVDANPAHRTAARDAVRESVRALAVLLHRLMAVHAGLRRRHVRDGRNLDRGVTVPAIETELADVELVAVRDGLNGTVARRPCTTEKRNTRRRRSRAPERDCPRWRRRSGACSTTGEKSAPMARTPGHWRTVCPVGSP